MIRGKTQCNHLFEATMSYDLKKVAVMSLRALILLQAGWGRVELLPGQAGVCLGSDQGGLHRAYVHLARLLDDFVTRIKRHGRLQMAGMKFDLSEIVFRP